MPAVRDEKGEGFVHVRYVELSGFRDDIQVEPLNNRIHDPPNRVCIKSHIYHMAGNLTRLAQGSGDVRFHSIFTEEIRPDEETPPTGFCAIQTLDKPLEFFNE